MSSHHFPSSDGRGHQNNIPVRRGTRETRLPIPVKKNSTLSVPRKSSERGEASKRSIPPINDAKRAYDSYTITPSSRNEPKASKLATIAPGISPRGVEAASQPPAPALAPTKRYGLAIRHEPKSEPSQTSSQLMSSSSSRDLDLGDRIPSLMSSYDPAAAASDQSYPDKPIIPEFRSLIAAPQVYPIQPSTPRIANTATPSTAYSNSPGVWSSRNTTPTTLSSYSPGVIQPLNFSPQRSQDSPFGQPSALLRGQRETPAANSEALPVKFPTEHKNPFHLLPHEPSSPIQSADKVPRRGRSKSSVAAAPHSPPPRKSSKKFSSPKKLVRSRELQEPKERSHISNREDRQTSNDSFPDQGRRDIEIPSRPSRQGVSGPVLQPSPVLQSDLSPLQVRPYTRMRPDRSESSSQTAMPISPSLGSQMQEQPHENRVARHFAIESTALGLTTSKGSEFHLNSQASVLERTPNPGPPTGTEDQIEPRLSKPNKGSSRFGFLSRKSKPKKDRDVAPDDQKAPKKGPAAGTGHEGYGKYGGHTSRGRKLSVGNLTRRRDLSASTTASTSRSMSSHQSSATSGFDSDMDDFLSQRLEPVTIRGGGGPLGSNPSFASLDSKPPPDNQSEREMPSRPDPGTSGLNITFPASVDQSVTTYFTEVQSQSIATRRSFLRVNKDEIRTAPRALSPIKTASNHGIESPLASCNTGVPSLTTDPSGISATATESLAETRRGEPDKSIKTKRWNIFSRARPQERSMASPPVGTDLRSRMPAAISSVASTKPTAFYALMDPDNELEDALVFDSPVDSTENSPNFDEAPYFSEVRSQRHVLRRQQGYSLLLPAPPVLPQQSSSNSRPSSPRVHLSRDSSTDQLNNEAKSDRLVQVGRIPKVISNRDRVHIPPSQSFSRPFVRHNSISTSVDDFREVAPALHEKGPGELLRSFSTQLAGGDPFLAHPRSPESDENTILPQTDEFLSFPPVAEAGISESSSSGQFATPVRKSDVPHDEEWKEYDDLIDRVLSPAIGASTALNSADVPDTMVPLMQPLMPPPRADSRLSSSAQRGQESLFVPDPLRVRTNSYLGHALSSAKSNESIRLRRSRIVSALHSSTTPSSPVSIRDLFADYLKPDGRLSDMAWRDSQVSETYLSNKSSVLDLDNIPEESKAPSRQLSTTLLDIAQRDHDGPIALSNLRFGALMTSRWLSFGRVLVSPAHEKIHSGHGDRILVIDGLGNDDWSFYCAETYPGAKVYNLSARDPGPPRSTTKDSWEAPQNHENVNHPRLTEAFPFPAAFFAAVVLRFPFAMPEYALKRTVSECKRVLRPGGYIELSVLDLDMVGMGNRTRRAVRDLKLRLNEAEPEVCLKPAGDNIQKLLGRKGFENFTRCMVSVPVAGAIGSIGSHSSRGSNGSQGGHSSNGSAWSGIQVPAARILNRARMSDQNFSLCELISDQSSEGDEKLADVIARVGRYFFTRCYERAVIPDGDLQRSIWADRRILRECEALGSGFKLLTAYAQKPLHIRNRTMSEPTRPTPAVVNTMLMKEYENMRYGYDL